MKIQVSPVAQVDRATLTAVLLPEGGELKRSSPAAKVAMGVMSRGEWKATYRESLLVYGGAAGEDRLLLVGLGPEKEIDDEKVRRAAAIALRRAGAIEVASLGIHLATKQVRAADAGSALAESLTLTSFYFNATRKNPAPDPFKKITVRLAATDSSGAFAAGVARGIAIGDATNLARMLGERPGNELTPTIMGREAQKMARGAGVKCRVYKKADLERLKMGGILRVAAGGAEPPVLIELNYTPKRFKKTVCLVGKGLTFDTGGISIKPPAKMEEMKYDMCGGAAVIGTIAAVASLKLPVRVIGIVPSSENMPGSRAQKPGDILVTASGLTVEVINTDAEGRLILSDGLHHAVGFDPDHIIDLATLTGACVVALGHDVTAAYGSDPALIATLKEAGDAAGDPVWPMPIYEEYKGDLKSTVADLKNVAGREAGAGVAASFLSHFVGDKSWAHLDIAGTAWGGRKRDYIDQGATGAGVRLLVKYLEGL